MEHPIPYKGNMDFPIHKILYYTIQNSYKPKVIIQKFLKYKTKNTSWRAAFVTETQQASLLKRPKQTYS